MHISAATWCECHNECESDCETDCDWCAVSRGGRLMDGEGEKGMRGEKSRGVDVITITMHGRRKINNLFLGAIAIHSFNIVMCINY